MKIFLDKLEESAQGTLTRETFLESWNLFKEGLNKGKIKVVEQQENGDWLINTWVKQFILLGFKFGNIQIFEGGYIDKDTMGERKVTLEEKVRTVSPGTSIRDGCYIGKNVTFMPPCYTNIGAYIDDSTMIDSCALVGSCAHIGKNVHLSAGAMIGGVLEPVGAYPVIIEDNVFIGANSVITEGTIVKKGAVIGAGVTLTGSTPVYDTVNNVIIKANATGQIVIPEGAVVISGTRKIKSNFDVDLSIATPIIYKYGGKVELEDMLRHN